MTWFLFFLYVLGVNSFADDTQEGRTAVRPYNHISTLSLFEKSEKIAGENLKKPHQLVYWPIIPGTDKVWIDGALKSRDVDYTIDYRLGQIFLETDVQSESTIRIDYRIIPISIKRTYQRQLFAPEKTPSEQIETIPGRAQGELMPSLGTDQAGESPATLNFSGTKTLSLSMESMRGLTINQPTRLNVSGQVSEDVSVMAMLSDQDLPLQPEGTTEEIEDLDRILIKVQGKNLAATLGDYEAAFGETEFVLLPKMLEGAQAEGEFNTGGFTLLGAVSKGQTSSVTLRGVEGQNEYRITADGIYIVMIAGSEIVWLNGEKMRRGEGNDYVIRDYGDPTVEFTNKHLITGNDIIVVDFEYIEEDRSYRQDLYGTRGKVNLLGDAHKELALGVSYATEADDRDNPLVLLNGEEIASLKLNELDPDGDGVLLPAPERRSVLGFDGRLNLGDNTNLTGEIALGQHDLNTFSGFDKLEESRAWKMNGASGNDKINISFDFRQLDPDFLPIGATLYSRSRATYQEEYDDVAFGEVLTGKQMAPSGEASYDLDLWCEPVEHIRLGADLGRVSNDYGKGGDSSDGISKRVINHWSRSLKLILPNFPQISTRYQEAITEVDGREDLQNTREIWELDHRLWEKLDIGARSEEIELLYPDGNESSSDRDMRREERGLTFDLPALNRISISGKYSLETEYIGSEASWSSRLQPAPESQGSWLKSSSANTISANLFAKPKSWLDFSGYFARRKFSRLLDSETLAETTPADSTTNLADLKLNLKSLRINYQIDKKLSTEREEQYVNYIITIVDGKEEKRFLKPGEGSYVKIDEYTFREDMEDGEYIRLVRTVSDRPVASVALQGVISFRPRSSFRTTPERIPIHQRLVKSFSMLETGLRISEEQESASRNFYLLQDLLTDKTIYGVRRYWARTQISPIKRFSLTANWETGETLNKRINNSARKFRMDRWDVRFESPLIAKLSLGGEWEQDNSSETVSSLLAEEDLGTVSDISQRRLARSLFLLYTSAKTLSRLKLEGIHEVEKDEDVLSDEPSVSTRTISLGAEATWSLRSRGSTITKYEIARGTISGELPFARFDFHEGISHQIRLETNYRLKWFTDLTARIIYRGEIAEHEKPDHRLEVEMTANF